MRAFPFAAMVMISGLVAGTVGAAGAAEASVAVVGSTKISKAALEDHVRAKLIEIDNERYEALREGLDEMVAEELMKQEAKARGMTPEALEKQEVDGKTPAPFSGRPAVATSTIGGRSATSVLYFFFSSSMYAARRSSDFWSFRYSTIRGFTCSSVCPPS